MADYESTRTTERQLRIKDKRQKTANIYQLKRPAHKLEQVFSFLIKNLLKYTAGFFTPKYHIHMRHWYTDLF